MLPALQLAPLQLAPLHLPLLLTRHSLEHLDATNTRATTITVVLTQILAHLPVAHGGINE
jgi:hypothetical protein